MSGRRSFALIMAGAAAMSACSDGDSPLPPAVRGPALLVVQVPVQSDTIGAAPTAPIVVRVVDDGVPVVGTAVVFRGENVGLGTGGATEQGPLVLTTDSRGEAAVFLRYGSVAGPASVVASVSTLGLGETLPFTVLPGAPAGLDLTVSSTAVLVGATVQATAAVVDRLGNVVAGSVPVVVRSGPLVAEGGGFKGTAPGTAVLEARSGSLARTVTITVSPSGSLALLRSGEVRLVRFDGSGIEILSVSAPSVREPSIDWSPSGERIVLGGLDGFVVYDLASGSSSPVAWPAAGGRNVIWPRFTPDGDTIYYSSEAAPRAWDIRRLAVDGTGGAVVVSHQAAFGDDLMPSWDPGGKRFVFTADREQRSKFLLRLLDPQSGLLFTIDVEGTTPVWSPKGDRIAFQELGVVGSVKPDGSGLTAFDKGWVKGVSWSPDGQWLAGLRGGVVEIMNVTTGEILRYPGLGGGYSAVAWRPEA